MKMCGICDEPRLSSKIRLPAIIDDMYADARKEVCPLCTDNTERSVQELLQHVHQGHCTAVATEVIRTNKFCLMATRERWEKQVCDIFERTEFVDAIKRCIDQYSQRNTRLTYEVSRLEEVSADLTSQLATVKTIKIELESKCLAMERFGLDMTEKCTELEANMCDLVKQNARLEHKCKLREENYAQQRNTNKELSYQNDALKSENYIRRQAQVRDGKRRHVEVEENRRLRADLKFLKEELEKSNRRHRPGGNHTDGPQKRQRCEDSRWDR